MDSFLYLPICLYLVFAGVFAQQGVTNILLARSLVTSKIRWLTCFTFASAGLCLSLLFVLSAPVMGLNLEEIRVAFLVCWCIAPLVGCFYVLTLAEHLNLKMRGVRWLVIAFALDFVVLLGMTLSAVCFGEHILFDTQAATTQSVILHHLGGAFAPNTVTAIMSGITGGLVAMSAVYFLRALFKSNTRDYSLILGVSLNVICVSIELIGFIQQWSKGFSLMPLANGIEVVRLTYLKTLQAGRDIEARRLQIEDDERQIKTHLRSLAHDVRTPLSSLKLGLGRIQADAKSPQLTQELFREVEYLHVVFSSLMTLIELELSCIPRVGQRDTIHNIVQAMDSRFVALAETQGVVLNYSIDPEAQLSSFDAALVEQIMSNLLCHAISRASSNVAICVYLRGEQVRIRILDDGPSATVNIPQLKQRVFRQQLEESVGCPGFGLSLAIAQSLAVTQGGGISLGTTEEGHAYTEMFLPQTPTSPPPHEFV